MHASSIDLITFNPGPSQLSTKILQAIDEVVSSGFLSRSHRSATFDEVSQQAIEGLRKNMHLPAEYHIFYQPSATVAMDTLLSNLVLKKSYHFTHGAFSNLFFEIACDIGLGAVSFDSPQDQAVAWESAVIPGDIELIAITHNETSTGLMWPRAAIHALRQCYHAPLIAVDVASSFGAMAMDWHDADIWFGSVQKCLGLPSGLGFLIASPRAFEKAKQVRKAGQKIAPWQRFDVLADKMKTYQTPETPNMLNIALLARQMSAWNLTENERLLFQKANLLYSAKLPWKPYVAAEGWRSLTVANFLVDDPVPWHRRAGEAGMVLGQGYGSLNNTCIRIANFPAITSANIQRLLAHLA